MKIDAHKLKVDESKSNPMVTAMAYPGCPINRTCFCIAVGGAILDQCPYLDASANNEDEADCKYPTEGP